MEELFKMINLYIECKCGKTAYVANWNDEILMNKIHG